jgi:hypothetical protein
MLYLFGLLLLAIGTTDEGGIGMLIFGGILFSLAIYHTAQWIRARRKDAANDE